MVLRARMVGCDPRRRPVNRLAETIAAAAGPYKAGRTALRARLVGLFRRTLREAGRLEANDPALERELVASDAFQSRPRPAVALGVPEGARPRRPRQP